MFDVVRGSQHLHAQEVVLAGLVPGVGQGVAVGARLQPVPAPGALAGQAGLHKVDVHIAALVLDAVRRHALVALERHQHRPCRAMQLLSTVCSTHTALEASSLGYVMIIKRQVSRPVGHTDADTLNLAQGCCPARSMGRHQVGST